MISPDDILDMSGLTRDEIDALAQHEHVGEVDAALLGDYLLHVSKGPQKVQQMICDDMRTEMHLGNLDRARALFRTLQHFMAEHPEAARGSA